MQDLRTKIEELSVRFKTIKESLNLDEKRKQLLSLEGEATDPNFWKDKGNARSVMQKIGEIKKETELTEKFEKDIGNLELISSDESLAQEVEKEIKRIKEELEKLGLTTYLNSPYDAKNAILSIHAGQGGTEAMDWAEILFRMYVRFCEKRDWETDVLDISYGEEAGIKSVTFSVEGSYSYGYLKGETGTHRLVRQSPFNADNLRQTSFARVEVLPEFEEVDLPDIKIKDDDLEWQFFRASSQGGQNVQKVSTAVRLIHKPTGVVVTAQSQRYQEQNRKIALNLLRAKLWIREQELSEAEKKKLKGEYKPPSWGTQIRSYVLHPYKMVKDLRTEVESSNPEAVLDGEIDQFIEAELKYPGA